MPTPASATAHAPDIAVNTPDAANRAGTSSVPSHCRPGLGLDRLQAEAIRAIPDVKRAAPPNPYSPLLSEMADSDSARVG